MRKYIKYLLIFASIFILTGCLGLMGPSEKIEAMLDKYIKNDSSIIKELEDYLDLQELSDEEKARYEAIIKKEYAQIKYEIKNETIEDNNATVEVALSVIDLYGASTIAENYLLDNPTKFYTDGIYDTHKFIDYKLGIMEKYTETKDYTIYLNLSRHDDIWYIEEPDEETLEKIHGIYNYNEIR